MSMLNKFIVSLLLFTIAMANVCSAQSIDDVRKFVQNDTERVLAVINGPDEEQDRKLTNIFEEVVDSVWMARFAIGAKWRSLDTVQQETYIKAYKAYLLKIYLPKFNQYHGEKYDINSIENLGDNQFIVHMTVLQTPPKPGIKLDYRVKCIENDCYIRDLIAENISMVTTQRSDFAAVIHNKGFDGLIDTLNKKGTKK